MRRERGISVEDVEAVVSDVSGPVLDSVLDAAFGGDRTR
jgi:DNA polymerase III delta subunit